MKATHALLFSLACLATLFSPGCMVGPKYQKPPVPLMPLFKEPLPEGWKQAEPSDGRIDGKWWEMYRDSQLNLLEEQVALSNQNVLAYQAQYREAKAAVRVARSALFPAVSTTPSITRSSSNNGYTNSGSLTATGQRTLYSLPFDVSWEPDVWGSLRRSVNAASAQAQATAAELANGTLSYQSELAQDYFSMHGVDADIDLFRKTAALYREYLKLTQDRFSAGVASDLDVAQAESQLESAQAQEVSFGVARAQYEHAIAVLTGKPPAAVTIDTALLKSGPPEVPVAVPSVLLNAGPILPRESGSSQPRTSKSASQKPHSFRRSRSAFPVDFNHSSITDWFSWPSHFFSLGPSVAETLFDAGKRHATIAQYQASYDSTVATYRQTVLTAFQQVEDALAAQRILQQESVPVDQSVKSAQRALELSTAQFKAGTADYLTVVTSQTTLLSAQRAQVDLVTSRLTSSVQLIVNLGGGWDTSKLPTTQDVRAVSLK